MDTALPVPDHIVASGTAAQPLDKAGADARVVICLAVDIATTVSLLAPPPCRLPQVDVVGFTEACEADVRCRECPRIPF